MRIITCPVCTEPYPLYLFEFGIPFWCRCGAIIGKPTEDTVAEQGHDHSSPPPTAGPEPVHTEWVAPPSTSPEPSHRGIELSDAEWQDLRAELEARSTGALPEFDWPYQYDLRFSWELDDERKAKELQRRADRICYLISATSYSRQEIEREQRQLKERCERYFPEIERAYDKVYARRFSKLWSQFREA
ncbi:MAG: hypothetical protein R3E97_00185 [Candidatus Eisenbacteria bacterium]